MSTKVIQLVALDDNATFDVPQTYLHVSAKLKQSADAGYSCIKLKDFNRHVLRELVNYLICQEGQVTDEMQFHDHVLLERWKTNPNMLVAMCITGFKLQIPKLLEMTRITIRLEVPEVDINSLLY